MVKTEILLHLAPLQKVLLPRLFSGRVTFLGKSSKRIEKGTKIDIILHFSQKMEGVEFVITIFIKKWKEKNLL